MGCQDALMKAAKQILPARFECKFMGVVRDLGDMSAQFVGSDGARVTDGGFSGRKSPFNWLALERRVCLHLGIIGGCNARFSPLLLVVGFGGGCCDVGLYCAVNGR